MPIQLSANTTNAPRISAKVGGFERGWEEVEETPGFTCGAITGCCTTSIAGCSRGNSRDATEEAIVSGAATLGVAVSDPAGTGATGTAAIGSSVAAAGITT